MCKVQVTVGSVYTEGIGNGEYKKRRYRSYQIRYFA